MKDSTSTGWELECFGATFLSTGTLSFCVRMLRCDTVADELLSRQEFLGEQEITWYLLCVIPYSLGL